MGELGEGEGNDAYIIKKKPATQHSAKNVESDYVSHVYILPSFTLFSSRSGLTHYFTHNDMICSTNKQNMLSCTHPGEKKKKTSWSLQNWWQRPLLTVFWWDGGAPEQSECHFFSGTVQTARNQKRKCLTRHTHKCHSQIHTQYSKL